MENINNLKKVEIPRQAPEALRRKIRGRVQTNLGIAKFIGNIVDLYIGSAGRVVADMIESFEEKEEPCAVNDASLPPSKKI
ncbi:MAG: hypothetical protein ACPGXZ_12795 [Saprospiraceae bacterium]